MPQPGLIFRVLVASPSDCAQERKIIPEVLAAWNAVNSLSTATVVEPVMWETHARPVMGDRPQAIINKQLVAHCDLLIGAFWTRLGTPTGEASSGTAEEIEQFRAANRPVLLYFSSAPVVPDGLDMKQYQALLAYRESLGEKGLYSRYETYAEFREQLQRHFASTMIAQLEAHAAVRTTVPQVQAAEERDPHAEQREATLRFRQQFERFLRYTRTEWSAERDSEPHSTDDGKLILSRAAQEVVHFRSMITHDTSELSSLLEASLRQLRALQRHQVFLDGGRSFRAFWEEGDRILGELERIPSILSQIGEQDAAQGGT